MGEDPLAGVWTLRIDADDRRYAPQRSGVVHSHGE
jgi:hypothetical protein